MDLSALSATAPLALLVDGENLSKDRAPEILRLAARIGPPQVRRVYGNAKAVTGWEDHGFRLCPTRPGKNAADMLLCVEAMSLALRDSFGTLVIASSDRDFSYLAEQLREIGKRVIGIGDAKAPVSFRNTCTDFKELGSVVRPKADGTAKLPATKLIPMVRSELAKASAEEGWSTANWIRSRLRSTDPTFAHQDYGEGSLETILKGLKYFEIKTGPSGTTLFRDPNPAKGQPTPTP